MQRMRTDWAPLLARGVLQDLELLKTTLPSKYFRTKTCVLLLNEMSVSKIHDFNTQYHGLRNHYYKIYELCTSKLGAGL